MSQYFLFSGTSHTSFSQQVASCLGMSLGKISFEPFPDGEFSVQISETVSGRDTFVIQTIARDPNNYLMELLIIVDALKRASAKSIVAVLPYFGYARQDRRGEANHPITAKLIADLLTAAGVTHILTMDLHAPQIQGFFNIPVENLYARPVLADSIRAMQLENFVIMAPDLGAIKNARFYANLLHADYAMVDKRRVNNEKVEVSSIIGNVKGRDVILVDDMCSTGSTLVTAAQACRQAGAKKIVAIFTHPLLVGEAVQKLINSPIEKIITTNTVPLLETMHHPKINQASVAGLFGEAIRSIVSTEAISSVFN